MAATIKIERPKVNGNKLFLKEENKMPVELKQNVKELQQKLTSLRGYL